MVLTIGGARRLRMVAVVIGASAAMAATTVQPPVGPADTARQYYAAYPRKDLAAIASVWSDQSPDWKDRQIVLRELFAAEPAIALTRLQMGAVSESQDVATVPVSITMRAPNADARGMEVLATSQRVMQLHRIDGRWRVWRETSPQVLLAESLYKVKDNDERRRAIEARHEPIDRELVRALSIVAEADRIRGNYGPVQSMVDLTLEEARALHDPTAEAMALNGSAGMLFVRSRFEEALATYHRALDAARQGGSRRWEALILGNIALAHRFVGEYDLALAANAKAIAITQAIGETSALASLLNTNAVIHRIRGNYRLAAQTFQKAIEAGEAWGQDNRTAGSLNGLGLLYMKQGQLDLAENLLQRSLKIRESMHDVPGIASTLNNLGSLYSEQQSWDPALAVFRRVLKMKEDLGDRGGVAITLRNLGAALQGSGKSEEAVDTLGQALLISRTLDDKQGMADALLSIAISRLSLRQYLQARDAAVEAGSQAKSIGALEDFWRARTVAGDASRALGQPVEAYAALREAIATIERLRLQLSGSEVARQHFLESRTSPYASLISLLVDDGQAEEALFVAEQAKARVLVETLRDGQFDVTRSFTAEQRNHEHELRLAMAAAGASLQQERGRSAKDPAAIAALQKAVDGSRLEYDSFLAEAFARDPETRVRRGQTAPLDRDGLESFLREHPATALIEYAMTADGAVGFVAKLDAGKLLVRSHRISGNDASIRKETEAFRAQVAELDLGFRARARALHQLLVAPLMPDLAGVDQIVIVPDGVLWGLPFQALESPAGKFLIEELPLFYAPSATALLAMEAKKRAVDVAPVSARLLAAFGNPAVRGGAGNLPNSQHEVTQLGQLYGKDASRLFVGAAATEKRLRQESGHARFVHLATHGVFDDASPMHSYVTLSPSKDGDDGVVEAWELMNASAASELTVLSACETARGRYGAGEGVIGMTWAIFVAGCPTTVVSQWKVDSASTTELMLAFHRVLRHDLARSSELDFARALRAAQLRLLRGTKYRHPFYWAGFSVIGAGM